ncbi:MAG: hypothetical protein ACI854_002604 [Arenicella sp.]
MVEQATLKNQLGRLLPRVSIELNLEPRLSLFIKLLTIIPCMRLSKIEVIEVIEFNQCRGREMMLDHARVVIIGGGSLGVSLLYHLTKEGWKDILLI